MNIIGKKSFANWVCVKLLPKRFLNWIWCVHKCVRRHLAHLVTVQAPLCSTWKGDAVSCLRPKPSHDEPSDQSPLCTCFLVCQILLTNETKSLCSLSLPLCPSNLMVLSSAQDNFYLWIQDCIALSLFFFLFFLFGPPDLRCLWPQLGWEPVDSLLFLLSLNPFCKWW